MDSKELTSVSFTKVYSNGFMSHLLLARRMHLTIVVWVCVVWCVFDAQWVLKPQKTDSLSEFWRVLLVWGFFLQHFRTDQFNQYDFVFMIWFVKSCWEQWCLVTLGPSCRYLKYLLLFNFKPVEGCFYPWPFEPSVLWLLTVTSTICRLLLHVRVRSRCLSGLSLFVPCR